MIEIYDNDEEVLYTLNGKMHRPNGPARIWWGGWEEWFLFDLWHRYYGPRDQDGQWWIHDKRVK